MITITIEGPDSQRFEVDEVLPSTTLMSVVEGLVGIYRKNGSWPDAAAAVVDRMKPDGSIERLETGQSIELCGVCDGDLLRISPERTAGGFDLASIIISIVSGATGTYALSILKLWLDERKSREVHIKCKDLEVTIKGVLSEKQIEKRLGQFEGFRDRLKDGSVRLEIIESPRSRTSHK